jgi:CheY-like chemotaxis protein
MHENPVAPVVLVADDDPAMRDFVGHALHDAGYNVRKAMDVPAAIGFLRGPGVAAAILDMLFVNSGGHSGLDVLRYIRSHPHLENVPVIVVTGFPLNQTIVGEIEALHGELWHKPVDPLDLVKRLHDLVYQHPIGAQSS